MGSPVENVKVIELDNSEDEEDDDDDVNLTMDAVPFQEKVEKWLISCNGAKAKMLAKDAGRIFQEETVVVKEVINETESLHSVDTEQYIKSNRRKTTTKITTTTIKKYYSMMEEAKNVSNNNEKVNGPLPATKKYSCHVNRKSPRKAAKNLPSVPEGNDFKLNVDSGCTLESDLDLNQVPFTVQNESQETRTATARKCRRPYNTRLNDEVKSKIRLCSEKCNSIKKPKRGRVNAKQNQFMSKGESYVKLKPLSQCTVKNSLSAKVAKKSKPKLTTGSQQNAVNFEQLNSDSEQDDILLTSYKPFSAFP